VLGKNRTDALLAQFPGPLTIGPSVPRHLLLLAFPGVFIAAGVAFILFAEPFAASLAHSHGAVRGEGLLRLLVIIGVARDMREALAEFGLVALAFGGIGSLAIVRKAVLGVMGLWGLTLDREGFLVKGLGRSNYHRWLDVGDFDSLELPWAASRRIVMRKCLVFNDYRAPETPIDWLRLTGRNRALIERYECPVEDLAVLMSVWREWSVADRWSQGN
jgi:hypothetical protein